MKAQSFEYQLQHTTPPAPDPQARLRAKQAALAEFERVHAQRGKSNPAAPAGSRGFLGFLHFLGERQKWVPVTWSSRNTLVGGIASACVAVIGASVVWLNLSQHH